MANNSLFNVKDATDFLNPLSGLTGIPHYVVIGKGTPWPNDLVIPPIDDNVSFSEYQFFEEMLCGKRITENDVNLMTNRYDWTYGTVYDYYDDQDEDLFTKKFYVVSPEGGAYHIFKCLNNARATPSLYPPKFSETAADDNQYYTADGYHWKYIYTIDSSTFNKFATASYVPVIPNTSVQTLATPGSIDSIVVKDGGASYFSYTTGNFEEVVVDGNTSLFSISSTLTVTLGISANATNNFIVSEFVTQANTGATGHVRMANSTALILDQLNGQFQAGKIVTGGTSGFSSNVSLISTSGASSNTGFYTGSFIYIKSGTGAGQGKKITGYTVVGTKRRITVESPFDIVPDLTSVYEIAPRVDILGDGTGAVAISTVNTATQSIQNIKILNGGSGYTFANVTVTGNTGTLVPANTAIATALIAPRGGHGSNVYEEFDANKVGIAITLANTDSFIIQGGSYRRTGILVAPKYNNIILYYGSSTGTFTVGEKLLQTRQNVSEFDVFDATTYQFSNKYTVNNYAVIQFSAPTAFSNGDYVTSTGATGVVVNTLSLNTLVLRRDSGTFAVAANVVLAANSSVNGTISNVSAAFVSGVIGGLDDANTTFAYDALSDDLRVFVNTTPIFLSGVAGPSSPQFTVNTSTITITNNPISNSSIVYIDKYTSNLAIQSITSNTDLYISGTIASVNSTALVLNNVNGLFVNAVAITGQDSGASATVTQIVDQDISFDNRTWLSGTYSVGSQNFAEQDKVYQYDSNNNVTASATIQRISQSGNTYTLKLTEMKGQFQATSNSGNKYASSNTGSKILQINTIQSPFIAPYSGHVLYAENHLPVTRAGGQNDTIRLVLSFY